MATKYVLEMDEEQAEITIKALDFWMRMKLGQWKELIELCLSFADYDVEEYLRRGENAEKLLLKARSEIMPELSSSLWHSHGVYKFPDTTQGFNILRAIRSCIAWHRHPEGGWTVEFDRPMAMHGEALPECKVKGEKMDE